MSAFLQAPFNVSSTFKAGRRGAMVNRCPSGLFMTKMLPRPEEAPFTCVRPVVSRVQDEITHQNCPAETSQGVVSEADYDDRSMFAEVRSTISSE